MSHHWKRQVLCNDTLHSASVASWLLSIWWAPIVIVLKGSWSESPNAEINWLTVSFCWPPFKSIDLKDWSMTAQSQDLSPFSGFQKIFRFRPTQAILLCSTKNEKNIKLPDIGSGNYKQNLGGGSSYLITLVGIYPLNHIKRGWEFPCQALWTESEPRVYSIDGRCSSGHAWHRLAAEKGNIPIYSIYDLPTCWVFFGER